MTHNLKIKMNEEEVKLALYRYATENIDLGERFELDDASIICFHQGGAEVELTPGTGKRWVEPISKWVNPDPVSTEDDLPF